MPKKRVPQSVAKVVPQVKNPIKLRNYITKGSESQKLAGICLSEISDLFFCFKRHNFNQEACAKEISSFKNCYDSQVKAIKAARGSSEMKTNSKILNNLLKKY